MKVLDLFSGIGGFSLGLERAGMETIAFCEVEPFCRMILKKHWPNVPIFEDIRELAANELPTKPDLVCGGYPCQPFSVAGKQRGKKDYRHLWPEMFRLIEECQPRWVIGENVAGHINLGLDEVLSDLESAGYEAQPIVIPACSINAPHKRERVWIVGYAKHDGSLASTKHRQSVSDARKGKKRQEPAFKPEGASRPGNTEAMAYASTSRVQIEVSEPKQWKERQPAEPDNQSNRINGWTGGSYWSTEPAVGRVADGIPDRVDRIRALGNSLVPQIPEIIGISILEIEDLYELSGDSGRHRSQE